tara:strand:- start:1762 stop:2169 length:408 start_codon:yes stop_codon:yes gene_type:complete
LSTLRVNTIQNASGSNASTTDNIQQGIAKAWVNFDGGGTLTSSDQSGVRDSFNISSVEDSAAGVYTVNINTDMADTNYVVVVTVEAGTDNDQTSEGGLLFQNSTKTAGSFKIRTGDTETNNNDDYGGVNAVVFGD